MKRFIVLTAVTLLGACSSAPPPQAVTPNPAPTAAQQRYDARITQVKTAASEVPDWYANPPKDHESLYAAGSADSSDLEFALDKAILSAKRSLADRVGGSVSSQHKEFLQEGSVTTQPVQVSDRSTTNNISDVVLNGYTVVQTKLVPTDTEYRAFVLLQYPLANASPAPAPAKEAEHDGAQDTKLKAAKAFEDLQKDIDAAKARDDVSKDETPPLQP
jgi:hypothetical protein